MKEMVGGCCVCSDERGWDENPLVYCDGQSCNVAVHQACYGIVAVPSGPWFCRKCESQERTARVHCELCPSRDGALKKTDTNNWAHVVCALYIPEVRFGNVTTMEPIQITLIPPDRYNKTCYICEENNKESKASFGACMTCNKAGCRQSFHVTCAQLMGLLCEEAGNLMDNVKYCGYCRVHYSKLKKTSNMKIIPPYKPIGANLTDSPASSPEKNQKGTSSVTTPAENQMSMSSSSSSANSNSSLAGKKHVAGGPTPNNEKSNPGNGNGSAASTTSNPSSMPRVPHQPSNLFSSGAFSSSSTGNGKSDESGKMDKLKLKLHGCGVSKGGDDDQSSSTKGNSDSSFKQEGHGKITGSSGSFTLKSKDFSNISMADVVAATLDRPITSSSVTTTTTSKFDVSSSGAPNSGGSEPASNNTNPTSNSNPSAPASSSSRAIDKPPPDIKPHVTLTPIPPIRTASSEELHSRHDARNSKSPAHHFPQSFGQTSSKLRTGSPDTERALNNTGKTEADLSFGEKPLLPTKRSRIAGVDDFDSDTDSATETWPDRHGNDEDLDAMNQNRMSSQQHLSRKERYIMMGQIQDKQNQLRAQAQGQPNPQDSGGAWERDTTRSGKSPTVSLERMRFPETEKSPLKIFGTEYSPKRGPGRPVKRHSGNSRDDESRDRRLPAKARGNRGRGGGSNGSFGKRDVNGSTPPANEEMPFDDARDSRDSGNSQSLSVGVGSRGGRHSGPTRKANPAPTGPVPNKKPNYDDIPTPTLSQLKAQMSAAASNASSASSSEKTSSLAPHMFGNVLNTNSSMANRLVDSLSQEMEAAGVSENVSPPTKLIGIPFPGKASTSNGTTGITPVSARSNTAAPPQTLEELLERQWEQGSQFLMEQAEHLDIAQLLSCLNQLKQDNRALEDHVASLIQRKEHLSAINARLQIPLSSSGTLGASFGSSSGQGTPPMPSLPVSNKGLTGRGPSPQQQLQQQIQQEALQHQGRIVTHPFPGTETNGTQMHGHSHMNSHGSRRELSHPPGSSSGQQVYGYPSGGLPVPVVTSHPSSQSHHPPGSRDRD